MQVFEKELSSVEAGSHLCAAAVTHDESHQSTATFLHDGIRRGEYCVLVAEMEHQEAVCGLLEQTGVSTASLRQRGALVLRDPREIYASNGAFDAKRTLEIVRLAIDRAHGLGFHAYRAASIGGASFNELAISPADVASYEAGITDLMGATRSSALCVFNRRQLRDDLLAVMLRTHPLALLAHRLCHNPFCDPPSYSRREVGYAKKIDWTINQILHYENTRRDLCSRSEALIREAVALSIRIEQQRQRGDSLQRSLEARDALLGLVRRWLDRPLRLSARLKSVLQDDQGGCAAVELDQCSELLASLQELTRNLHDVDAAISHTASLCPQETDLVQLVSAALASLPRLAAHERADIRLVAPGRLVGWWDHARLSKVVEALIEVAWEHGLDLPVDLRLEALGSTARLSVQFHTCGSDRVSTAECPSAQRENPDCVRAWSTQESSADQLALALWAPRETIRQMGGRLGISTWPDARVLVTVELPRSATTPTEPAFLH